MMSGSLKIPLGPNLSAQLFMVYLCNHLQLKCLPLPVLNVGKAGYNAHYCFPQRVRSRSSLAPQLPSYTPKLSPTNDSKWRHRVEKTCPSLTSAIDWLCNLTQLNQPLWGPICFSTEAGIIIIPIVIYPTYPNWSNAYTAIWAFIHVRITTLP